MNRCRKPVSGVDGFKRLKPRDSSPECSKQSTFISLFVPDRARSILSRPSSLPRHERRSRNSCGYIDRLLVFRKAPEVRDEFGKGREQPNTFFQRLSRAFRRGDERAEFFQCPGLGIELVQPQELALLIDFQKPPLAVVIHGKVNRAETDVCLAGKLQDAFFNIGRRSDDFHRTLPRPASCRQSSAFLGLCRANE